MLYKFSRYFWSLKLCLHWLWARTVWKVSDRKQLRPAYTSNDEGGWSFLLATKFWVFFAGFPLVTPKWLLLLQDTTGRSKAMNWSNRENETPHCYRGSYRKKSLRIQSPKGESRIPFAVLAVMSPTSMSGPVWWLYLPKNLLVTRGESSARTWDAVTTYRQIISWRMRIMRGFLRGMPLATRMPRRSRKVQGKSDLMHCSVLRNCG